MLRDSAQGCPCPPARASPARPQPSAPAPPPKAQEPGPEAWVPPGASAAGLRPRPPGLSLQLPAQPPGSAASEGPPPAPCSLAPARARPGSPGGSPDRERDDQAPGRCPERPRAADGRPGPCGVDAGPLPRTAWAALQEATRLIQEEFAFDGYLDNGLEALIMGTGVRGSRGSGPHGAPHFRLRTKRAAAGASEPGRRRVSPAQGSTSTP